jgi:hypothetical protein
LPTAPIGVPGIKKGLKMKEEKINITIARVIWNKKMKGREEAFLVAARN